MERNHSIEKFDQIKWRSSDDQISGSGQAKSYTCTFCKRGFSNAQALGGHMNMHRRDRARIRQFSEDQNQLANNSNSDGMTNKTSSSHHHRANSDEKNSLPLELNETTTVIPAKKYPFSMEHDHDVIIVDGANKGKFIGAEEVHQVEFQLPTLFVEDPSGCGGGCRNEETIMKRTEELDLELRLGPEPTETSTSLSTREFF